MANEKGTGAAATKAKYKAGIGEKDSKLKEFFQDELKDIYWAEKHVVTTMPKLGKEATSTELKDAFTQCAETAKTQVGRLEQIFTLLDKKAVAKKCDAMDGIMEESKSIIEDTDKGTATRDVGLILAAQKVLHYEISTYGGLQQIATTLGLSEAADLLKQTLEEEKKADVLLSNIAKNGVNYEAAGEEED